MWIACGLLKLLLYVFCALRSGGPTPARGGFVCWAPGRGLGRLPALGLVVQAGRHSPRSRLLAPLLRPVCLTSRSPAQRARGMNVA